MDVRYLAIEREYGSGGREIAEETARRSGLACYGREVLEAVARKHHVSEEELQHYEESVSGSFLYSMFVMTRSQTGDPDLLSWEGKLFVAEARMIQELAKKGPAVFVGHCAGRALRDFDGVARVFIRADGETKRRRIIEDYHIPGERADAVRRRFDKKRANYYTFCNNRKWNDPEYYDLVLDSTRLGVDGCAAALSALLGE